MGIYLHGLLKSPLFPNGDVVSNDWCFNFVILFEIVEKWDRNSENVKVKSLSFKIACMIKVSIATFKGLVKSLFYNL